MKAIIYYSTKESTIINKKNTDKANLTLDEYVLEVIKYAQPGINSALL